MTSLSGAFSDDAVRAAFEKARDLGVPVSIAVVDAGAHLVTFRRMDGACLASIDLAVGKAKTARMFDRPTGDVGARSQPGGSYWGLEGSSGHVTFPGGFPIRDASGTVVGAIGVAGAQVRQDQEIARCGADACQLWMLD